MEKLQHIWRLKNAPTGPLADHLDEFARLLDNQGYCRQYIGAQLRTLTDFSRWLQAKNISAGNIAQVHVKQFLKTRLKPRVAKQGYPATLRRLMAFLQQQGMIQLSTPPVDRTPIQQIVDSYGTYLIKNKGLAHKTLVQYGPFVERFLTESFAGRPVDLSALSSKDVIDFIKRQSAQLSVARAKVATRALRSFLRYAVYHGDVGDNLIEAVPSVASWSMTSIPRAISPEHIQAVLAHCRRDTAVGKRDYAILLLLAHLGLRSSEIVALMLDDINWETGCISVKGKGGKNSCLPLPAEVGDALVDYLQHGRPECKDRNLFLRSVAPRKRLGASQTIATLVNAAITRADVDPPTRGSHQFRHAIATNMLREGASLAEIACILRHQHLKTTNIYAKVDIDTLRQLSQPWPGGVS